VKGKKGGNWTGEEKRSEVSPGQSEKGPTMMLKKNLTRNGEERTDKRGMSGIAPKGKTDAKRKRKKDECVAG